MRLYGLGPTPHAYRLHPLDYSPVRPPSGRLALTVARRPALYAAAFASAQARCLRLMTCSQIVVAPLTTVALTIRRVWCVRKSRVLGRALPYTVRSVAPARVAVRARCRMYARARGVMPPKVASTMKGMTVLRLTKSASWY